MMVNSASYTFFSILFPLPSLSSCEIQSDCHTSMSNINFRCLLTILQWFRANHKCLSYKLVSDICFQHFFLPVIGSLCPSLISLVSDIHHHSTAFPWYHHFLHVQKNLAFSRSRSYQRGISSQNSRIKKRILVHVHICVYVYIHTYEWRERQRQRENLKIDEVTWREINSVEMKPDNRISSWV